MGEGQWGLVGIGVVGGVVGVVVGAVVIVLGVVGGDGFSLSRFGGVGVVNASAWFGGWVCVCVAVFAGGASVVDTSKLAVGSSSVSLGGQQGGCPQL